VSIITCESLFERYCRMEAVEERQPFPKLLKFRTPGKPEVILAYTRKDWDLATFAAAALAGGSVDLHTDWVTARLTGDGPDDETLDRLSDRMTPTDTWLVALVSERAVEHERLVRALEVGSEAAHNRRVGVLPVRYAADEWEPPAVYRRWPRIEEVEDKLLIFGPNASDVSYPLRRWLRSASVKQHYEMR
jgi:hypothetical protein